MFSYRLSGITAFALVTCMAARDIVMPIVRFITWGGTSLLALLFVADWYLPKPLPEPAGDAINRPVIRISARLSPLALERQCPTKRTTCRILARGSTPLTSRQSP